MPGADAGACFAQAFAEADEADERHVLAKSGLSFFGGLLSLA